VPGRGARTRPSSFALETSDLREIWNLARDWDNDGNREDAERLALEAAADQIRVASGRRLLGGRIDALIGLTELCERAAATTRPTSSRSAPALASSVAARASW
jgi:hypothetical protein